MPIVSIIVPVYNTEQYIYECIDSILAQSFSDFELVLVDDGSTDQCPMICDFYASKDSRIKTIHQKNQGQGAARNTGVKQSKGEWICFVDSDDIIHPQMIEQLYMATIDSKALISWCDLAEGEKVEETFILSCKKSYQMFIMDEDTWICLHDANRYPCWISCARLIHRDIICKYPFCEGKVYEDNAIVCYWFWEAGIVTYIPQKLYFYRINPEGTTKSRFSIKKLDYLWALEEIIQFCRIAELPRLRERFCSRFLRMAYAFRYQLQDVPDRKKILRKIRRNTLAFLKKEKIVLSGEQKVLLLDLLVPGFAHARELISVSICQIRDKGFRSFFQKTIHYLKKRGNNEYS